MNQTTTEKMNIVILDGYAMNPGDLDMRVLDTLGKVTWYDRTPATDVVDRSADADVLVINKVKMTADVLSQLPRLRMICVSATGYNVVDTEAARDRGIVVTNAPDYSSASVAQTVFALLLNMANHTDYYARENRAGRWTQSQDFCYQDRTVVELAGKTMGIVGMGNIGQKVSRIAIALGMHVWALTSKCQDMLPEGVEKKTWNELLAGVDILSLHCPQTAVTERMINADALRQMKPSAMLINTARGGLIDDEAVACALREGRLQAYAADVLAQEPPTDNNPLLSLPNVYLTPHIAWASYEARKRLLNICTENIRAFIEGRPINVVN